MAGTPAESGSRAGSDRLTLADARDEVWGRPHLVGTAIAVVGLVGVVALGWHFLIVSVVAPFLGGLVCGLATDRSVGWTVHGRLVGLAGGAAYAAVVILGGIASVFGVFDPLTGTQQSIVAFDGPLLVISVLGGLGAWIQAILAAVLGGGLGVLVAGQWDRLLR